MSKAKKGWTRRSYDAVFRWSNPAEKKAAREIMLADGLTEEVARLDAAKNMGVWYSITEEAAAAVSPAVIEASAKQAERELNAAAAALGRKGGMAKSEAKIAASRANGRLGGRPPKKEDDPQFGIKFWSMSASDLATIADVRYNQDKDKT